MAQNPVTLLSLCNRVLVRLRETQVSSVADSDYAGLIVRLLNDAKREVEDAYNWINLRDDFTIGISANQQEVPVEGTSTRTNTTLESNDRTRILSIFNITDDYEMIQKPRKWIKDQYNLDTTLRDDPLYWCFDGSTGSTMQNAQLLIHPISNGTKSLKVDLINPQEDLTEATDYIKCPHTPVYLRALSLAIRERGEDEGEQYSETYHQYMVALNDAMAYEQRHAEGASTAGDWFVP